MKTKSNGHDYNQYNIIIAVCLFIFVKISLEFFNIFYFNESKQYYTYNKSP